MTPLLRPDDSELVLAQPSSSADTRHPPLHSQEKALVGITALHLSFLPWALGTMHVWSQLTSLGLAAAGFLLAAWPRRAGDDFNPPSRPHQQWPAARLLQSPVFWAALAFLGYMAVQGMNPAWRFFSNEDSWWLEPLDPVAWLPSGVDAPFARSNSWRMLTIFGSLTLLVSSVWAGFSRRKSYHALFTLLITNAGLLALFGLVQRLSGARKIFGSYVPSNESFAASFIYPNHAGPYLYLMVALAIGLARWHHQRARKRLDPPGRAVVFVILGICCSFMVVFTYSRLSIFLLLILLLLVGSMLALQLFQRTGPTRTRPEFWPVTLILAAGLGLGLVTLQSDKARARFAEMLINPGEVQAHALARKAAGAMFHDHWLTGWGAGCFRYGFPKYTKEYPEIHAFANGSLKSWEHAHNDLIEFPIEFGVGGLLPLGLILGYGGWQLCRRHFWRNVVSLSLVLGCALVALHAWMDFVFQNPAILLTWSVLLVSALRWSELDQPKGRVLSANRAN